MKFSWHVGVGTIDSPIRPVHNRSKQVVKYGLFRCALDLSPGLSILTHLKTGHMANRRMFSKAVTNSSKFLRMPATSRLLYYDLGMNADDDGFVEWYAVLQMTGAKEQDLQVLAGNEFVRVFDEKVLIIIDWRENNYLRPDRYSPSKLAPIYGVDVTQVVDGRYTIGIPNGYHVVDQVDTQVRLELGKSNINITPPTPSRGGTQRAKKKVPDVRESITEEVLAHIAEVKQVGLTDVRHVWETLQQTEEAKGSYGYISYKAALMNWIDIRLREGKLQHLPHGGTAEARRKPLGRIGTFTYYTQEELDNYLAR